MFEDAAKSHLVHRLVREALAEADTLPRQAIQQAPDARRFSDYDTRWQIRQEDCEKAIEETRELLNHIREKLGGIDATKINVVTSETL